MSTRCKEAIEFFGRGYGCAQSMLCIYGESHGIDKDTAVRLGRPFGSGMAIGSTCGAVMGAVAVLGLALEGGEDEAHERDEVYEKTRELVRRLRDRRGSIDCKDILGVDLSTNEGEKEAMQRNLFGTVCVAVIRDVTQILEELLLT